MMERERPARKQKPEAWLDQSVRLVHISGSSTEYVVGRLDEVNDRGIVLLAELHVGHPPQALFYPWSAVVQLSENPAR